MKHLLNTLYVTTQGSYLSRDGEAVLVRVGEETKARIPIHNLGGIVCFGQVLCSPPLMGLCAERQVAVSFLTDSGRFWARVEGPVSGNVLLRRAQFRAAEATEATLAIARWIVLAKLANTRTVLLRGAREAEAGERRRAVERAASHLAALIGKAEQARDLETLRGMEGEAARAYFAVLDCLIVGDREAFRFTERSRRPPMDNVNALLSFLYTLLVHDVQSALTGVGLDPAVGFLHSDRPGRPSLALDLMEEFRAVLADRVALSLINRRQVKAGGFRKSESGAVEMDDETRKEVLVAWQKRKQEEVIHPFLQEKLATGLLPHVQALLLARYLRNGLDAYPALIWK